MASYLPVVSSQSSTAKATALVGSHSVILGFDVFKGVTSGEDLLGFAIDRMDAATGSTEWLTGQRRFRRDLMSRGQAIATNQAPIQQFRWGDYALKPATEYLYRIYPVLGTPDRLILSPPVVLNVVTTCNRSEETEIYTSRDAAALQHPYGRSSRTLSDRMLGGLDAALLGFIDAASPGDHLKIAASQFEHEGMAEALKRAVSRGVHVWIVYGARGFGATGHRPARLVNTMRLPPDHICRRARRLRYSNFIVHINRGVPRRVWSSSAGFGAVESHEQPNLGLVLHQLSLVRMFDQFFRLLQRDLPFNQMRRSVAQLIARGHASLDADHRLYFSPVREMELLRTAWDMAWHAKEVVLMNCPGAIDRSVLDALRDNPNDVLCYGIVRRMPETSALELFDGTIYESRELPTSSEEDEGDARRPRLLEESNAQASWLVADPWANSPHVLLSFGNLRSESQRRDDAVAILIERDPRAAAILAGEIMRAFDDNSSIALMARAQQDPTVCSLAENGSWTLDYDNPFNAKFRERIAFVGR